MNNIIESYMSAYNSYHGVYPTIAKKGAWIYINGDGSALRLKDLPEMAKRLRDKKKELELELELNELELDIPHRKKKQWEKEIGEDLIHLFLEKISELCSNSPSGMERFLKDFITSGYESFQDNIDQAETIVNLEQNNIEQAETIFNLEEENNNLKGYISDIKKIMREIKNENSALRENSVLFTMDDIDSLPIKQNNDIPYWSSDDDIPF